MITYGNDWSLRFKLVKSRHNSTIFYINVLIDEPPAGVYLQGAQVFRAVDFDAVAALEGLVVLDPCELSARFGHRRAAQVDGATDEAERLLGVLVEPPRLVCCSQIIVF